MSETIFHRYKFKRRTTAEWASINEVLFPGEPGIEVLGDGSEKRKYGDGIKTWSQLPYATDSFAQVDAYVHSQPTPATTWTINHNMGAKPIVEIYSTGGQEIEGDVIHTSNNQTLVVVQPATGGFARLL